MALKPISMDIESSEYPKLTKISSNIGEVMAKIVFCPLALQKPPLNVEKLELIHLWWSFFSGIWENIILMITFTLLNLLKWFFFYFRYLEDSETIGIGFKAIGVDLQSLLL